MNYSYTPKIFPMLVAGSSASLFLVSLSASAVTLPGATWGMSAAAHRSNISNVDERLSVSSAFSAVTSQAAASKRPNPQALHAASLRGDLPAVQRLVKDRVNIHYANNDGETALHMAASRGHLPIVIFLIQNKANINARTIGNWIPLHHAVRFNRQNVATYLLAKGSPAYYKTSDGLSSMDIALAMRNQRLISLVKRYMR